MASGLYWQEIRDDQRKVLLLLSGMAAILGVRVVDEDDIDQPSTSQGDAPSRSQYEESTATTEKRLDD